MNPLFQRHTKWLMPSHVWANRVQHNGGTEKEEWLRCLFSLLHCSINLKIVFVVAKPEEWCPFVLLSPDPPWLTPGTPCPICTSAPWASSPPSVWACWSPPSPVMYLGATPGPEVTPSHLRPWGPGYLLRGQGGRRDTLSYALAWWWLCVMLCTCSLLFGQAFQVVMD